MGRDIKFNRDPYKVVYFKDGEKHTIRRVPPPKLHPILPQDRVELTRSKNADFKAGDRFEVKDINPRQPNVLHIQNEEGIATFIDHYDAKLMESNSDTIINEAGEVEVVEKPIDNDYLLWP